MRSILKTKLRARTKAKEIILAALKQRSIYTSVVSLGMLFSLGGKVKAQSCSVTITQTPNSQICAGTQVTLAASSSFLNFGTGVDGSLTVNSTYYTDGTRVAVVGTNNSNTNKVRVANTAGFAVGNEVMVITMVDANIIGNLTGQYEFMNISSVSGDTLLFTQNHLNTYNASVSIKHQVIKVPQYSNVVVSNGGIITCNSWNGSTGGVVCFRSTNNLNINAGGSVSSTGKGYRGIGHNAIYRNYNGAQGEGIYGQNYLGASSNGSNGSWNNANGNGGGGGTGTQDAGGAGGGSYGTSGSGGVASGSHNSGSAGSTVGNSSMTALFFGGAGGEGGADEDGALPGLGGNGAGIIYISANSLSLIGNITCNGINGGDGSNTGGGWGCGMAGGGGGAGGSIYLSLNNFSGTGSNINSLGGNGGANNNCGGTGGNGGNGRIRINMPSIIPVTNPVGYFGNVPSLAGVTYSWSNGAITSSIVVSPSVTTNYSVTITSTTGCTGTSAVKTVTVNSLPIISVVGNMSICTGESMTLTASGANTYSWTGNINNNISFNPLTSDTYTVTGTNTITGCIGTSVVNTTVNTTPTVVVSGGTICSGNSFVFNPTGAFSYLYTGGSATVSPLSTSVYTITGISAQGCISQNVATVVVNSNPTITVANGVVCEGQSFTLSPSGALTYTFSNGPIVTPSVTSSYTITGTSAQGCVSPIAAIATVTVNQNPIITINNSSVCEGESFTLTPSGALTYTYSSGQVVTPFVTTSYSITGTSAQGCISQNPAVVTISVNSNPTITVADGIICQGQSFTLNPSGALTYTFSNGQIVTPSVTSTYTISGTSAEGCESLFDAVATVTVNSNPTITVANGVVCEGQSFTLTPSGALTYTFSNGPIVTPSVNSSYTITGTSAEGCVSPIAAIATVTVNQNPIISINNSAVCEGESFTLTPSGALTYTYSSGQVVTPFVTTSYTITGTSAQGCISQNPAVVTISVNSNPTITVADGMICQGQSFTLNPSGALTYTFSNGPVVTPSVTSTYTISGTSAEGCESQFDAVATVTVNSNPTITVADGVICEGQSFTLSPSGALTYTFSNGQIVTPTLTTSYTITGTSAEGCDGNNVLVTVTVNALPNLTLTASLNTVCIDQTTIALNGFPSGGVYSGINVTDSTFTPSMIGTFNPIYTYTDLVSGCSNTISVSIMVDNCTKLKSIIGNLEGVLLFPNPNNGIFTIQTNCGLLKNIEVMDVTGRVLLTRSSTNSFDDFNISDWVSGVYFVSIISNQNTKVIKIIKN